MYISGSRIPYAVNVCRTISRFDLPAYRVVPLCGFLRDRVDFPRDTRNRFTIRRDKSRAAPRRRFAFY